MDQGKGKPEASLDRESPEPLYQQIAARIEEGVRAGWLRAGDQIESEPALASTYGVSRVTIRQAIGALARKGLVIRKQGKGTFVAGPAVRHDMQQPHGLFWSLFEQSDKASVRLLRYELQTPPEAVRAMMSLDAGEQALALERLYLIDGTPGGLLRRLAAPQGCNGIAGQGELHLDRGHPARGGLSRDADRNGHPRGNAQRTYQGHSGTRTGFSGDGHAPQRLRRGWNGQGNRPQLVLFGRLRTVLFLAGPGGKDGPPFRSEHRKNQAALMPSAVPRVGPPRPAEAWA